MKNKKNVRLFKNETQLEKFYMVLLLCLPLVSITWNLDNDIWFLLSHGRYVMNSGFPEIEPLTIHEDFAFVMQQWLFSSVSWGIFDKCGVAVIFVVLFVLACFIGFLLFMLAYICSGKKIKVSALVVFVSYFVLCCFFLTTRPQIITYIMLISELICLELYAKTEKVRYLLFLPVISVVEINMHASMWGLLFVFYLPFIVNSFSFNVFKIKSEGYKKLPLLVNFVVMLFCGLINPYGIKAMKYVVSSYGQELLDKTITEMAIISIRDLHGFLFFALLFAAFCFYKFGNKKSIALRYELLLFGTAVLALLSQKSLAFFMIGCIPFFAFQCSDFEDKIVIFNKNPKRTRLVKITLPIYIVVILVSCLYIRNTQFSYEDSFPVSYKAIDYLATQQVDKDEAKIYTSFENGGYAEFKGFRVYMDARAEVFLKDNNEKKDVFEEYLTLQSGTMHYSNIIDQYNFSHLIVDKSDILYTYLEKDKNYIIIYEDDNTRIYIPN